LKQGLQHWRNYILIRDADFIGFASVGYIIFWYVMQILLVCKCTLWNNTWMC